MGVRILGTLGVLTSVLGHEGKGLYPKWYKCQHPKRRQREKFESWLHQVNLQQSLVLEQFYFTTLWFQLHVSNSYFCLAQFDSSVLFLATKYILTDTCEMVWLLWLPFLGQAPDCQ